jgi:hypothetical protein
VILPWSYDDDHDFLTGVTEPRGDIVAAKVRRIFRMVRNTLFGFLLTGLVAFAGGILVHNLTDENNSIQVFLNDRAAWTSRLSVGTARHSVWFVYWPLPDPPYQVRKPEVFKGLSPRPTFELDSQDMTDGLPTTASFYRGFAHDVSYAGNGDWAYSVWFVPSWLVVVVTTMPAALWTARVVTRVLRRRNRLRNGLCVSCGYDLRGTADRCPECGAKPDGLAQSAADSAAHPRLA